MTSSKELNPLYGKTVVLDPSITVAVVGAAGKMGTRVSNNLNLTDAPILYVEASEAGQQRLKELGREVSTLEDAAQAADVVILAVPDVILGKLSEQVVPLMKDGSVLLTLDPAAAYEGADEQVRDRTAEVIRAIYAPVIDVHWVTVKQLAQLEPTLVETTGCMIGQFLKDSMDHAINEVGIPEKAVKALFYGHIFISLTNALRGSNPFSEACLRAMDYGRENIIKPDWAKVWDDEELDTVLAQMLNLDKIER